MNGLILLFLKVREAAESLVDGVIAQACGSYRRGKKTCGDVDVLVTHPDGKSHKGLFAKLLAKLKAEGKAYTAQDMFIYPPPLFATLETIISLPYEIPYIHFTIIFCYKHFEHGLDLYYYAPNFEEVGGAYCFWCVRVCE